MKIFDKHEKNLENSIMNIWGNISAAEKNLEHANKLWEGRSGDMETIKRSISNVRTLMEANTYNLIIRDKIIEKKEEYQLVKLVATMSSARGAQRSLMHAVSCYADSIEAQLKNRGLAKDTVEKMINAGINQYEKEKEVLVGAKGLRDAGIFQDPNSGIRYKSDKYTWSEKNKSVTMSEWWEHGFVAADLFKKDRDIVSIENDVRKLNDLKKLLPHMTDKQLLSMLEDDFNIDIQGAKQKDIVVSGEVIWKRPSEI